MNGRASARRGRRASSVRPAAIGAGARLLLVVALAAMGLVVPAAAASADSAPEPVKDVYVLPDAYLGVPYSAQLTATGGVGPYDWSTVGGIGCDLPPGLALSESGLVSGTPTLAVGHCTMNDKIIDHSPDGDTYHPVSVTITVQAVAPPCTAAGLAAAVNAAADGSVVTVCGDLDTSGHPMTVPAGRHVTIDLAGHALTASGTSGAPALDIPTGASVTVCDTSFDVSGGAVFDGITDDGTLTIDREARVTSNGTISGTGMLDGDGRLQNNGAIRSTVTVKNGLAVAGHNFDLLVYPNDGLGGLEEVHFYAATLGDAGIPVTPMRARPGYTFSGWYWTPTAAGDPVTDATDFTTGGMYRRAYSGWSKDPATVWYVDAASGNDDNACDSAAAACKTIEGALEKASAGGTVMVAAGFYGSAHGGTDLSIAKSVTLQGVSAGSVAVAQAAGASAPVITVSGGAHVTVSGMTVIGAGTADAVVDASGTGTGLLLIDTDITDDGDDTGPLDGLAVHGNAHADVTGGTIHDLPYGVQVAGGGTLTVSGATISDNGDAGIAFGTDAGSGSSVDAATVSGNGVTAADGTPAAVGGTAGIVVNGGGLRLSDSTVTGNGMGLMVGSSAATVTVAGGRVDSNLAGGIGAVAPGAVVSVTGTAVTGNNRGSGGAGAAGITAMFGGSVTVSGAVISGNGIGVSNVGGTVTVTGSVIESNENTVDRGPTGGGGIVTASVPAGETSSPAATTIAGSTIVGNQSGILATGGTTSVTGSTIAGNLYFGAVADAHGLTSAGPSDPVHLSLVGSTVANNGRVGVAFDTVPLAGVGAGDDGAVTLAGTIVAGGSATAAACAVGGSETDPGTVTDVGYSLNDDGSCALTGTGSIVGVDPTLGALADNGSTATPVTQTMLPAAGSPAVDRIPVGVMVPVSGVGVPLCAADSVDQRGASRPAGAKCDIGAAERDESTDTPTDPGTDPGVDPGTDPGTDTGGDAGTDPGTEPGTDPGGDPGTGPGVDPGEPAPAGIEVLGESGSLADFRIAGSDRYATAALLAARYVAESGTGEAVIVANGTDAKQGADALAANYLAGRLHAPILLATRATVAPETLSAVRSTLAGSTNPTIYIMGKADSISSTVVQRLATAARAVAKGTVRVARIAGADRYATAAKAASAAGPVANSVILGGDATGGDTGSGTISDSDASTSGPGDGSDTDGSAATTAILASGTVTADALAAGPLAYAWGLPVLLTGAGRLPSATAAAIRDNRITQLIVLGGADRTPRAVLDQAAAAGVRVIRRVAGVDRFATAAALYSGALDTFTEDGAHYGTSGAAAYLANGTTGFADALAAGPVAGEAGGILLTVPAGRLPKASAALLASHAASLGAVIALGSPASIAGSVLAAAQALAG